jgi:hypothetical protein
MALAVARIVAALAGAALVISVIRSAMLTVVVPRGEPTRIVRFTLLTLRAVYDLLAKRQREPERRDGALARFGPSALLGLALVWALGTAAGFVALYWSLDGRTCADALVLSGSSLTTLGFRVPAGPAETSLSFAEAILGLGIIALLISYLPTIYTLFSRREAQVVKLDVRAGSPPTALEMLVRFHRIGWLEEMNEAWDYWEDWFVELEESHTSHPLLVFFRSQRPASSWITGAGAVLDTMAVVTSVLDVPDRPQTAVTIRSGFMALRAIARYYGVPFDPAPAANAPIAIYRGEFMLLCDNLESAGLPLRADREQAWRDFAGWRVNYDEALLALCSLCAAPATPWSSDRSARFHRPSLRHPRWRVDEPETPRSW